ncbi:MAG: HU family DNA-binding protein [Chloroflexi bacterium]|nr:HU family DNA-binding protein [Chloroflexota bacterium]
MDELVKMLQEKVGLSEQQAKMVIDLVLDYIKAKLPDSLASQVDSLLKGEGPDLGDLMKKGLGGLFG